MNCERPVLTAERGWAALVNSTVNPSRTECWTRTSHNKTTEQSKSLTVSTVPYFFFIQQRTGFFLIAGPNSPYPWLLQNASLLCLKIHKTATERLTTERQKQGFGNLTKSSAT
jgi:hypothetical protein